MRVVLFVVVVVAEQLRTIIVPETRGGREPGERRSHTRTIASQKPAAPK